MAKLSAAYVGMWAACLFAMVIFNTEGPLIIWLYFHCVGLVAAGVYYVVKAVEGS